MVKSKKVLIVKESSWFLEPYLIIQNLCFDLLSSKKRLVGPIFQFYPSRANFQDVKADEQL